MTQSAQSPRPAQPPFWPGLLLNLLLPGSGYTYLNRPLLHLGMLALTLLVWAASYLLVLYVGYSGLSQATALSQVVSGGLTILAFLLFFGWYVLLTRLYVQIYRQTYQAVGPPSPAQVPLPLKLLLIGVQAGIPLWLVLQNPMI